MWKKVFCALVCFLFSFQLSSVENDWAVLPKFSYGVNLGFRVVYDSVSSDNVPMFSAPRVRPGASFTLEADLGCRWYPLLGGRLGVGANFLFAVPHDDRYDIGAELSLQARLQAAKLITINLGIGYVQQYLGNDPVGSWTDGGISVAFGAEFFFLKNRHISLYMDYKVKYLNYENSSTTYRSSLLRMGLHFWL